MPETCVAPARQSLKLLKRDVIAPLTNKFPTPVGEVGFEHGGVHSLRHYFVTEAFRGGATEAEVQDWVGHRDSRIVRRYRHLRKDEARQTMQRLNLLEGDPPKPSIVVETHNSVTPSPSVSEAR
jgi:integrase